MKPGALLRVKKTDTLASDTAFTYTRWVKVDEQVIFLQPDNECDLIRVLAAGGVGWIWLDKVSVVIP